MEKKTDNQGKLEKIRQHMKEEKLDAYLVLSSDFHNSEYVGDYFKCREYISGFTGSAGSVAILQKKAGLWTDGRYFLQAEKELTGSDIQLYRMGEENVPKLEEYLEKELPEGGRLGVDGRTISLSVFRRLKKKLEKKHIDILLECDLIGDIWQDRPKMSCEPAWELDVCYAGQTRAEKIKLLREKLKEKEADVTLISALDDIAWTLNVRGMDVTCTPVVLSYLVVGLQYTVWFVQPKAVNSSLAEALQSDGIEIRDYHDMYKFISEELRCHFLYLDPDRTNMMIVQNVRENLKKKQGKIVEGKNITLLPKAVKNTVEIENMRKAHIKDAVACTKFIYWLKKQMLKDTGPDGDDSVTEISAAEKLEEFRQKQEHYLGPSFNTIVGYAEHGAIVHYSAKMETNVPLQPKNYVLIDSGGHYLEGTTDITRTIALGELTEEQKHYYTLVLKGNLKLGAAKFKYGCAGINLDYLARESMWMEGVDYNHGTGHGVGYLSSVHESPNCFRSQIGESRDECVKLEAGMVTSNEPGIYLAGAYGIRLENLVVCKEIQKNEYGCFMEFETLTLVPFERDAILAEELDDRERKLLNEYHKKVFQVIGPYLETEELKWLQKATAEI